MSHVFSLLSALSKLQVHYNTLLKLLYIHIFSFYEEYNNFIILIIEYVYIIYRTFNFKSIDYCTLVLILEVSIEFLKVIFRIIQCFENLIRPTYMGKK